MNSLPKNSAIITKLGLSTKGRPAIQPHQRTPLCGKCGKEANGGCMCGMSSGHGRSVPRSRVPKEFL